MKRAIGWTGAWICFLLGDLSNKLMQFDFADRHFGEMYFRVFSFLYQRLMGWSTDSQDWGGGFGPWHPTIEESPCTEQ